MEADTNVMGVEYRGAARRASTRMGECPRRKRSLSVKASFIAGPAKGRTVVVPGYQAKAVTWMSRLMPRRLLAQMSARVMRRG